MSYSEGFRSQKLMTSLNINKGIRRPNQSRKKSKQIKIDKNRKPLGVISNNNREAQCTCNKLYDITVSGEPPDDCHVCHNKLLSGVAVVPSLKFWSNARTSIDKNQISEDHLSIHSSDNISQLDNATVSKPIPANQSKENQAPEVHRPKDSSDSINQSGKSFISKPVSENESNENQVHKVPLFDSSNISFDSISQSENSTSSKSVCVNWLDKNQVRKVPTFDLSNDSFDSLDPLDYSIFGKPVPANQSERNQVRKVPVFDSSNVSSESINQSDSLIAHKPAPVNPSDENQAFEVHTSNDPSASINQLDSLTASKPAPVNPSDKNNASKVHLYNETADISNQVDNSAISKSVPVNQSETVTEVPKEIVTPSIQRSLTEILQLLNGGHPEIQFELNLNDDCAQNEENVETLLSSEIELHDECAQEPIVIDVPAATLPLTTGPSENLVFDLNDQGAQTEFFVGDSSNTVLSNASEHIPYFGRLDLDSISVETDVHYLYPALTVRQGNVEQQIEEDTVQNIDTSQGVNPEAKRKWVNKATYCKLCSKSQTHFTRHLTTYHPDNAQVQEIQALQARSEFYSSRLKVINNMTDEEKNRMSGEEKNKLEEEVDEAKKMLKGFNQQVRKITSKLRCEGAHELNLKAPITGAIIPTKMPNHGAYVATRLTHSTCPECLKRIRNDNFPSHLKRCLPTPSGLDPEAVEKFRRRAVKTSIQLLVPTPDGVSIEFRDCILRGMHNNLITLIVSTDPLILDVGMRIFGKTRDPKHYRQVRRVLRDLARLYITIDEIQQEQEDEGKDVDSQKVVKNLTDCIDPQKFDIVVQGLRSLASYDPITGEVKVTSISGRYQGSLQVCAEAIRSNAIQSKEITDAEKNQIKQTMQEWLMIVKFEWVFKIGGICETSRKKALASKVEVLPLNEDLRTLCLILESIYPEAIKALKTNPCKQNYMALCRLIITDIILLCRRRPQEVCRATLHHFSRLRSEEDDSHLEEDFLTEAERRDGASLKIFYVPGKGNTPVPILITPLMEEGIQTLMSFRALFKIPCGNDDLLFAKPFEAGVIYEGSIIMSEFVKKFKDKLVKPDHINCRSLRRHIATESQLHHQDNTYTKNLAKFLGHSISVHDDHYNRPVALVHRKQVGTRLLSFRKPLASSNGSSKTPNAPIGNSEVLNENDSAPEASSNNSFEAPKTPMENPEVDINSGPPDGTDSSPLKLSTSSSEAPNASMEKGIAADEVSSDDDDNFLVKRKRCGQSYSDLMSSDEEAPKKVRKPRWTEQDKKLIRNEFGHLTDRGENPERRKVAKFYADSGFKGKRSLNSVVTYIHNQAKKNK